MATVGNLFLNIGGSAKGLQNAVKSAKKSMGEYGRASRKTAMHELARLRNRQAATAAMQRQVDLSQALGPGASPAQLQQLNRLRGAERTQQRRFRRAQHGETAASMRRLARLTTTAVASVLGVTIAGLAGGIKMMATSAKEAKQRVKDYRFMGPQGAQIIQEEVGMMLDAMKAAADPTMSSALLKNVRLKRQQQQAAMQPGGTAQLMLSMEDIQNKILIALNNIFLFMQNLPMIGKYSFAGGGGTSAVGAAVINEAMKARYGADGYQF